MCLRRKKMFCSVIKLQSLSLALSLSFCVCICIWINYQHPNYSVIKTSWMLARPNHQHPTALPKRLIPWSNDCTHDWPVVATVVIVTVLLTGMDWKGHQNLNQFLFKVLVLLDESGFTHHSYALFSSHILWPDAFSCCQPLFTRVSVISEIKIIISVLNFCGSAASVKPQFPHLMLSFIFVLSTKIYSFLASPDKLRTVICLKKPAIW